MNPSCESSPTAKAATELSCIEAMRAIVQEDERLRNDNCDETRDDTVADAIELKLQLDQLQLEQTKRKVAIAAFRRQVEQQIHRLQDMVREVATREALMDAAFERHTEMLRGHPNA
ncbi:hypothetical protein ACHHYP_03850 [Achlya hypogyna]|uniref:Uncharacterized protein n=1 Tax=Achlya hypogyna TaxID=1202772 RepID=A0A1V9Z2N6_ACHHY|nr:hypothetical protein ACHHYP_03850 [Achlya hypogyna]